MKKELPVLSVSYVWEIIDDFRDLSPNDPSVWPLLPRVFLLVALLLTVIGGGWWFFLADMSVELDAKEQEELALKQQFLDKKRQAINLDLYKAQLAEIDRTFGALLKQLPDRNEMEALLIEVNQAGLGRGLQFELFRPGGEQARDFYAELPITVRIVGGYHDFGAFAADIGKLPRIVTLNNIQINPMPNGTLGMDATTRTFRYLEADELAGKKSAGQEGKK